MKKSILQLISVFVCILFVFPNAAYADPVPATRTSNKIIFEKDGVKKELSDINIYSINNNNYFMLRDIGYLMDIHISHPTFFGIIEINLFEAYEGEKPSIKNTNDKKEAIATNHDFIIHNKNLNISGYNIDGYTFYPIRELADAIGFPCSWDEEKNEVNLGTPDITKLDLNDVAKQYIYNLDEQHLIEDNNVKYKFNSKNYSDVEAYIKNNYNPNFDINSYIVVEESKFGHNMHTSDNPQKTNILEIRFNVYGYDVFFGYKATIINEVVKIIEPIGEWNEKFKIEDYTAKPISDEELIKMAIENDGLTNQYSIVEKLVSRYFDMETLKFTHIVNLFYDTGNGGRLQTVFKYVY